MEQEVKYLHTQFGDLEEEESSVRTQRRAKMWLVGAYKDVERARSHIGLHLQGLAERDRSEHRRIVPSLGLPHGFQHGGLPEEN
jgi:hypothetical protein